MEILLEGLRFQYPRHTFRMNVPHLQIRSGAQVAFVGPSGSGKTTLLRLLAGIHRPESGKLTLGGVSIPNLSDAQRRAFRIHHLGLVFQDFQLIDYLDVQENIRLPFRIHRELNWDEAAAQRLEALTEATNIADKRRRPVDRLSQGEQQRVAICRALIAQPRLILADEPTGNLDPSSKHRVLDMLCAQARDQEATLIVVTHDEGLLDRFERVIDFQTFHESNA